MRAFALLAALAFLVVATVPPAAANYHARGTSPVPFPMRGNPQLFCIWVMDEWNGYERCMVDPAKGTLLRVARIEIVGGPSAAHLAATRYLSGSSGLEEQIAILHCEGVDVVCEVPLWSNSQLAPLSGHFSLFSILYYGAADGVVKVTLES